MLGCYDTFHETLRSLSSPNARLILFQCYTFGLLCTVQLVWQNGTAMSVTEATQRVSIDHKLDLFMSNTGFKSLILARHVHD